MPSPIIIVGIGELGSVFARAFLKSGYPVQPVTRAIPMQSIADKINNPTAVLIAVGEGDIHNTLADCPKEWINDVILIQNELLPRDWKDTIIKDPTVISVWFEKKKGMDSKVLLPSPVFGKHSKLIFDSLSTLDLPCVQLDSLQELEYELVKKNCYILTTNIAGLQVGGNVENLAKNHRTLMLDVLNDVINIQDELTNSTNDREKLTQGMLEAFESDPLHNCMGRSAPIRLKRALEIARAKNIPTKTLDRIAKEYLVK